MLALACNQARMTWGVRQLHTAVGSRYSLIRKRRATTQLNFIIYKNKLMKYHMMTRILSDIAQKKKNVSGNVDVTFFEHVVGYFEIDLREFFPMISVF